MKAKYLKWMLVAFAAAMLISCSAAKLPPLFTAQDLSPKFDAGAYTQKTNTFLVILDASGSMNESHSGQSKFDLARGLIDGMNQTIPAMKLTGGLNTFGFIPFYPHSPKSRSKYGLTDYNRDDFAKALTCLRQPQGNTPLSAALEVATEDLVEAAGNIAVIIFSDGKAEDQSAVAAAEKMEYVYGDRLCITTVQVGDDAQGKKVLAQVSAASGCGVAVNADDIYASQAMAGFVEKVFLVPGPVVDSDGDGVPDNLDQCPDTPTGVTVDGQGCPLDGDADGVYDYLDQCPDTPMGAYVNALGCWVMDGVFFDFESAVIKAEMYPAMDRIANVLQANPNLLVDIQGHTCWMGPQSFNLPLSQQRADAVRNYLITKGIAADRLFSSGYGELRPIASNKTKEGRAMNRRVQFRTYE
jgi:OmpA-OmpF porin, OOP family